MDRSLRLRDSKGGEHRAEPTPGGVTVDATHVDVVALANGVMRVGSGSARLAWTAASGDTRWVFLDGEVFVFEAVRPSARRRASLAQGSLTAPMPATVRRVVATAGTPVKQGDVLLVLEAMKMELPVRAPGDGTVARVKCREGDLVQAGQELIELAP
jgi:acetyl-CoA/propionyl-CoA carboxylase, biotin carboxylase, biotin carboxyl carrier protein